MHRVLLSPFAEAVARRLGVAGHVELDVDDHALADELGLAPKTVAVALRRLAALGAISVTALSPGPRRRRGGPPSRRVRVETHSWVWAALAGGDR